jgi:flagellar basal-body rod protein FlgB
MKLFENTKIPVLSKALDAYTLRHKVISSNIANIGTVGYRSQSVSFEDQLNGAMKTSEIQVASTNENHVLAGPSQVQEARPIIVDSTIDPDFTTDPTASGVNNVDIDREMTELAKNQLQFKFASKLIGDSFRTLQKSIRGTV